MKKVKNQFGLTMIELVLVFIVVVTTATIASVSMQKGLENRRAKQVAATLQSIGQAVRSYELENGTLPTRSDLSEVFAQGFLDQKELAYSDEFDYSFVPSQNPSEWKIQASQKVAADDSNPRLIEIQNQAGRFELTDSQGFLHSSAN